MLNDSNDIQSFDDLSRKLREESNKPQIVREFPLEATVTYVLPNSAIPLEIANHQILADSFTREFGGLRFDVTDIQPFLSANAEANDWTLVRKMALALETTGKLRFHRGMLVFPSPKKITPIDNLILTKESVIVSVNDGSSTEAEFIAQRAFELLWKSTGVNRDFADFKEVTQLVGYTTRTKAAFNFDLLDMFSIEFKEFAQETLINSKEIGKMFGRRPYKQEDQSLYTKRITIVPHVTTIRFEIAVFDNVTGIHEYCTLGFDIAARSEKGFGQITVTSELDSERHTQLVNSLYRKLTREVVRK